jgi:Flp pilus assembly protein TadB
MRIEAARDAREAAARTSFKRLIAYTIVAGVLMVIGALYYMSLMGPLTATSIIATTLGVFFSVLVGAGLMALGFLSSNSGHDDRAAGHVHREAAPLPHRPEEQDQRHADENHHQR